MEFQRKDEGCNEKLIKTRQNSNTAAGLKQKNASSKEAGCCCLDILKFAFCGLVCCKKTRGVVKDVKDRQQKNSKEDVNENKFEKAAEEIEVGEKTTLLSDFENPSSQVVSPLQIEEDCEEASEKETKQIPREDKEEHQKISLKSFEKEEEDCEKENLVSKEDISPPDTSRKTPEGSEEKNNKGLDAETQAPTPKKFLVRTDSIQSHQKEVDTEMVAAVAGTNQFYTLVSEVNFIFNVKLLSVGKLCVIVYQKRGRIQRNLCEACTV